MARESKKDPQDLTVEEKLKALYQLQTKLSKIDEIRPLRGELPLEVEDLEDEVAGLNTRIERIKNEIEELKRAIVQRKTNIEDAKASIAKYTEQQNNVSNNRQYDLLSKEIEYQSLEIELCEKKIREATDIIAAKSEELAESEKNVKEIWRTRRMNSRTSSLRLVQRKRN